MPLVIDTYNVLQVEGVLPPEIAGIEIRDLIGLIDESRYRRRRVILVCDGLEPADVPRDPSGRVRVVYSGHQTADDVIEAIIRRSTAPRRLTVVTADRAILKEARKRRCPTLDSGDLLRQLALDHESAARGRPADAAGPAYDERGLLPEGLIAEAEAIEQSLGEEIADELEAKAAGREAARASAEAEARRSAQAETEAETKAAERARAALESFLPADLIAEAEAMGETPTEQHRRPPPETQDGASPPPAVPPASDILTNRMIEEAERMWREAEGDVEE